jgi:hypothetical protein
MDARRALPRFGVVALLLGLVAAGLALLAHSGHLSGDAGTPAALGLATGLLGSLILWYRPGNHMGRVLTVTGVLFGLIVVAGGVLAYGGAVPSGLRQAALAWAWLAGAMSVPWMLFILWFPDGRFTSRAWQRFFVTAAAVTLTLAVTGYLLSRPGGRLPAQFSVRRAPIGLAGPLGAGSSDPFVDLSDVASLLLPLVALISLVQRYRCAGTLVRQQVKWLLAGTAATIIGSAASVALASAGGAAHGVGVALLVAVNPLPIVGHGRGPTLSVVGDRPGRLQSSGLRGVMGGAVDPHPGTRPGHGTAGRRLERAYRRRSGLGGDCPISASPRSSRAAGGAGRLSRPTSRLRTFVAL